MKNYHITSSYQQYSHMKGGRLPIKNDKMGVLTNTRKGQVAPDANNTPGVIIQPIDEEDPFELTAKHLAVIRFDRNNRLMSELFNSNYLPDTRNIMPQARIEAWRKQAQSLTLHQVIL